MREFGGYLGFEHYTGREYHENAIALNSGRNCLRYLIRAKQIKSIAVPRYICSAVTDVCLEEKVEIQYYDIDWQFKPSLRGAAEGMSVYVVNYFGQLEPDYLEAVCTRYSHVIIDNSQDFYAKALPGADTLYTCRKFFGVCDGAYLYTDRKLDTELVRESAYSRMGFLLGRYECGANAFYGAYQDNEKFLAGQDIRYMSCLTQNIMKSLDYDRIGERRTQNYGMLADAFGENNRLSLSVPNAPYMYPLLIDGGGHTRSELNRRKIYTPLLWPNVLETVDENDPAFYLAKNILPLPCDQRYSAEDMADMIEEIRPLIQK